METEIDKTNIKDDSSLKFVKEVAKYFMNFLDIDFKKGRIPYFKEFGGVIKKRGG